MHESVSKSVNEPENRTEDHRENGARIRSRSVSLSYFSTGQAARELGISTLKVRILCVTEAIKAEATGGGQWRVPVADVNRLKAEGTPSVPRRKPAEPVEDMEQLDADCFAERLEIGKDVRNPGRHSFDDLTWLLLRQITDQVLISWCQREA